MEAPPPISLAIALQPSFIANSRFMEFVSPHELQQLIDSDHIKNNWDLNNYSQKIAAQSYINEKHQLENYQSLYNKKLKGFLIRYSKARHNWGRGFPVKSLGLTSFSKKTRNTLIRYLYYDYDLANAQPEIVRNLCRQEGFPIAYDIIDQYCKERESIIASIIEASAGKASRDDVKALMIRLSFFGGFAGWLKEHQIPEFPEPLIVKHYRQQIGLIANLFITKNPEMFKTIQRIKQEKGENNVTGAFFSTFLQEYELRIVENVMKYLCSNTRICVGADGVVLPVNTYNAVYEFDGIKLWKANVDAYAGGNEAVLALMNDLLKKDGWDMRFEIKPITKHFPIVFIPLPPEIIIDREELKERQRTLKEQEKEQDKKEKERQRVLKEQIKEQDRKEKERAKEQEKYKAKEDLLNKRNDLLTDPENLLAQTDLEASIIIYNQLKDRVKYVNEKFYYKKGYYWLEKVNEIKPAIRQYVMNSGINKLDEYNKPVPFVQNKKNADAVASAVMDKCLMENKDDKWGRDMFKSSLGKILFENGYYDFHKTKFFAFDDKDYDHSIVFIYHLEYDYLIPKTVLRKGKQITFDEYKTDVKRRLFVEPFCEKRAAYYILTLARGLAGDVVKRFLMCIGESECGKSTITTAIASAAGSYFGSFNGNNICCKKFANPDAAQALRWVMELRGKRFIASNEISTQEYIDGEMMKKLASGGRDKIVARGHGGYETEFDVSFLPILYANDIEKIKPFDSAIESRLRTFVYDKVYVDKPSNDFELTKDAGLDAEILTDNFRLAFIGLLVDSYAKYMEKKDDLEATVKLQLKEAVEDIFEDAAENSIADRISSGFTITNLSTDFETNTVIEDWLKRSKIGITISKFARDMKRYTAIHKLGDVKKGTKDKRRGWFGIASTGQ